MLDGTTVIPLPEKDICASARWPPLSVILNVAPGGAPETSTELRTGGSREKTVNGNGPSVLAPVSAFLTLKKMVPGKAIERYGMTACSVPESTNVVGRDRSCTGLVVLMVMTDEGLKPLPLTVIRA